MTRAVEGPLPEGLRYLPEFVAADEERELIARVQALDFREVRMHGIVARRRTRHFGWDYGYSSWKISPAEPVPEWLLPLRTRAAGLISAEPGALEEVLISEYAPGAGIG